MNDSKMRMAPVIVLGLMMIFTLPCSQGLTDPRDMLAIYDLYINLGTPPLLGWTLGGNPCQDIWQGVQCVGPNITAIILPGANLTGHLSQTLDDFVSMITIDLSNNNISGSIPENLPVTMRQFFLSGNQFTGTIPSSLSNLTLLTAMAVNDNLLEGELPDAFQSLTGLTNLDLSSNNLSGQLPPSMGNLSSLSILHVENNHLSGMLNVLQDLPLGDLNIENNLFSGPIPPKLLTIPNFKRDGNLFNTTIPTIPPSPAPSPSLFPPSGAPVLSPSFPANSSHPGKSEGNSTTRVIIYAVIAVTALILAILIAIVCISKWRKKLRDEEVQKGIKHARLKGTISNANLTIPNNNITNGGEKEKPEKRKEHESDMKRTDAIVMPSLTEQITVEPVVPPKKIPPTTAQNLEPLASLSSFSVASLQQYTNSFVEDNLISKDKMSKVYLAELPDGKLLTVMKIDNVNSKVPAHEFLGFVSSISKLRHPNVLELVGYCSEFEQRLLVYNYFSTRTLHDILHREDDFKKRPSWNARVKVLLGAARALEYLHEVCRPPVVHQNFDSTKILLDDRLNVRISECGLASLTILNSAHQIRALPNYEAPEVDDLGSYTDKSDVYRFGVVMLELLTGCEPYDSTRPREQRYLVRWASSQLYDINALSRIVDPSLDGVFPMKSLSWFADIVNRCIQQQPEFRPLMSEVVQDLTRMIEDTRTHTKDSAPPNYL